MTGAPPRGVLGPDELDAATELLQRGGLIAIPTDTVYGIACDPGNAAAAARLDTLKGRPPEMELSILGDSLTQLEQHGRLDGLARELAERFWPGALSLIVPVAHPGRFAVPRRRASVSLRIPDCAPLRALLRRTGALASSSANRHGELAASTWEECLPLLDAGLDAVLMGPPAAGGGSTIIDLTEAPPRVLRAGSLSPDVLRSYLGG